MNLQERDEGDYRIYGGALEAAQGDGYIAAVVISRVRGGDRIPREAFRDEALAGGHRWSCPEAALSFAMNKGAELLRTEPHRLADSTGRRNTIN